MTFKELANYLQQLEATSSRLKITEILANLFKETKAEETAKIVYLVSGRLLPAYEGLEFQMAEKMMIRAVAQAVGYSPDEIEKQYKQAGDLGTVAENFKEKGGGYKLQGGLFEADKKKPEDLAINEVYKKLMEIAQEAGEGSVERKIDKMAVLIEDLDSLSCRFIVRIPLGKLRLGFSELTIIDALSWMEEGNKSLRQEIEAAFNVLADIGKIAQIIKKEGVAGLKTIQVEVGTPVVSALAQRLGTVEEMLEKMGEVAVEPKYDGTRLQLHYQRNKDGEMVRIFTRNLENVTHMFPDIAEALKKEIRAESVILDSEGVGVDPDTGKYLPFQETMKRKRKHEIKETVKSIPLKAFVFDILYKDGKSLIPKPLSERRKVLEKTLPTKPNIIVLSPQIVTKDPGIMRHYHDEQIKADLEGAMVKKVSSPYTPGRRDYTWVKFKQEETKKGGGLADTVEAVIMGVTRGRGKRAEFGVGTFLVGIRKGEKYVTVTSIGTGLSDEQFRELNGRTEKLKVKEKPADYVVHKNDIPDDWIEPKIVVEIQADNITQSPTHTAGLAMRFPRLIRFRDDKRPDQVTTLEELEHLYELQFGK
ncbi:MAG: ATP-dependent DNA ligase [Patescibacteria group bacterium]|jgi:DNA ligase-1